MEQRVEHRGDVAVGALESRRHLVDQRRRRIVRHEVLGELVGDMMRRSGLVAEDVERLLHFSQTRALDRVAEQHLVRIVVPGRVELEQTPVDEIGGTRPRDVQGRPRASVDADAGQGVGQGLDVGLRVARADAHRV